MKEINNNIPNYGMNIGKIEPKKEKEVIVAQNIENENEIEKKDTYIQDTGVLGRSQVVKKRGGDINKSVDEAVFLAKNDPELLNCGDYIFEKLYDKFIEDGMNESDAYINALAAQSEFLDIAEQH